MMKSKIENRIEEKRLCGEDAYYGGLMEISGRCGYFVRRYDFDAFSMADYNSCENCRNLGPDDRCRGPR